MLVTYEDGLKQFELTEIRYNAFVSAAPEEGITSIKLGDRGDKMYFSATAEVAFDSFHALVTADGEAVKGAVIPDSRALEVVLLPLAEGLIDVLLATDDARERDRVTFTTRSLLNSAGTLGRLRVGVGDLSSICEDSG